MEESGPKNGARNEEQERESKRASVEFKGMTRQAGILLVIVGLSQSSCGQNEQGR